MAPLPPPLDPRLLTIWLHGPRVAYSLYTWGFAPADFESKFHTKETSVAS